jgi:hypothetical protein
VRFALVIAVLAGCGRIGFDSGLDAAPVALEITKLTLHGPTGVLLLDVTNGGTYDITPYPNGVTVVATVAGTAGSVDFVRNGLSRVENTSPYLSGGNAGGAFRADQTLAVGANTLAVTAYELVDRGGARGPTRTIDLTLTLPLTSIPLISMIGIIDDNNASFIPIEDGKMYSIATLPTDADLRIDPMPSVVGSVVIGGIGPWASIDRIENYTPYTAMGLGNAFTPVVGMQYEITARAYTEGYGRGQGGNPFTLRFSVGP